MTNLIEITLNKKVDQLDRIYFKKLNKFASAFLGVTNPHQQIKLDAERKSILNYCKEFILTNAITRLGEIKKTDLFEKYKIDTKAPDISLLNEILPPKDLSKLPDIIDKIGEEYQFILLHGLQPYNKWLKKSNDLIKILFEEIENKNKKNLEANNNRISAYLISNIEEEIAIGQIPTEEKKIIFPTLVESFKVENPSKRILSTAFSEHLKNHNIHCTRQNLSNYFDEAGQLKT